MHLSDQVIVGNLAGNSWKQIRNGMNPLKLLLDFGSSPGHQVLSFQFDTALSSSDFESTQDSNFEGEL